jgi:hypothetical protein
MKPNSIYSKSGKGVQEASGKTSLLKRGDRAVLSAIDGRATLAEVAQKVGKSFDGAFQTLVAQLDKEGFIREVTAAPAASTSQSRPTIPAAKPAPAKPAAAPAPAGGDDLDFTSIMAVPKRAAAPPAPQPKPDPGAQQRAKEQEAALYKARQEAEARAQAERDRLRQETEAKARAEAEAKIRAETEKKLREEAEKKKLREAAEVKALAEAEAKAKAAREEAMRIAAEAKAKAEEAERKLREEAEKARREAEELRQRLEEERKLREEEERRRREEEERRRREEEERRAREAERQAEEARMRAAREMEAARERARSRQHEERQRKGQEETKVREPVLPTILPQATEEPARASGGSLDALMADLDSFSQREEEERQAREAAERKVREEKKRRAQEEAERRAREQAAHEERERQRAAEEARRREEEERRAQEEAEQRLREAEESRRLEAEERKRRAQEALAANKATKSIPAVEDIPVTEDDLGLDDVRRDEAAVARETRKAQREREREQRQRQREARERAEAAAREQPVKYPKARRPIKWGRPVAITFFVALVAGVAALHIVPLPMTEYEDAASQALGRPVKVGVARLSLFTGVRLDMQNVTVGGRVRVATVQAYPRIGSLIDEKKAFRRLELDGVSVSQQAIGEAVGAQLRGENFSVGRIVVKNLRLEGPVPLPVFEADAVIGSDGAVRSVTLRGPDSLNAKLTAGANGAVDFDVTAASLTVPFVPGLSLASFAMKGSANRQGMNVASWGGAVLDGALSGTATVRWAGGWQIDGVMTVRGINAAVFAPALLSEGKAEGTARFTMSGADPRKLYNGARIDGSFNVGKGILGTFDLSRVLQTSGRQYGGRTPFTEMSGQAVYDRGAVALRNINISAGALNAGASADIAPGGALTGKLVADIRTTAQPLRATLILGGTVKEPQVRN